MLPTMKKYFFKLPVLRKWKFKQDQLNIKRGIETLNGLKELINFQTYHDDDLKEVCEVLIPLAIDPNNILKLNKLKVGTFYSETTQRALNFIDKNYFTGDEIKQYRGMTLKLEEKPINCWISSEQSIRYFIDVMSTVLKKITQPENPASKISEREAEFANSMLFRLLLSDFATLVALILEIDYETNQRKI